MMSSYQCYHHRLFNHRDGIAITVREYIYWLIVVIINLRMCKFMILDELIFFKMPSVVLILGSVKTGEVPMQVT